MRSYFSARIHPSCSYFLLKGRNLGLYRIGRPSSQLLWRFSFHYASRQRHPYPPSSYPRGKPLQKAFWDILRKCLSPLTQWKWQDWVGRLTSFWRCLLCVWLSQTTNSAQNFLWPFFWSKRTQGALIPLTLIRPLARCPLVYPSPSIGWNHRQTKR